jgi:hypothetical protein
MNLDDFIKNADELDVVALETNQLKEISGGIGGPVLRKYDVDALDYIEYNIYSEGCYSC